MTHIAYLGTGLLGGALAEAAAKRGDQVTAWNRSAAKARALEPFGVTVAATPAEAVRGAERVHLVLTDDAVVDDVIAQLRPGLGREAIIVDHSTTLPDRTAERAQRLAEAGVRYLHCPVFIGPAAARAGQGTILAAGPAALFERVKPALEAMANKVLYAGERPDLAAVYKLCGNAYFIGMTALLADVQAVAAGARVSADEAMRVVESFDAAAIVGRGRAMIAGVPSPTFELEMARKDVRLMIETAGNEPLAVLPGTAARMDVLIGEGLGRADATVLGRRGK